MHKYVTQDCWEYVRLSLAICVMPDAWRMAFGDWGWGDSGLKLLAQLISGGSAV